MVVIVLLEARNLSKSEMIEKDAIAAGMKTATEAITNIRTVASLSTKIYDQNMEDLWSKDSQMMSIY